MKSMGVPPRKSEYLTVLISEIKILGFQSADLLQIDENIKHSYFIYPDENVRFRLWTTADHQTYTGSTRTFSALLQSCTKLNKHALALCRFRRNTQPEFAVLIPQPEEMSADGKSQEMPPGFHIVVLPYRDDIRAPPKIITGSEDIGGSCLLIMEGADDQGRNSKY